MKYTIELTDREKKQMDLLCALAHQYAGFNPKLEPIENSWESELEKHRRQAYDKGYADGKVDDIKQVKYTKGLEDARRTLLNLLKIPSGEWANIFDTDSYYVEAILRHYSINEIAERINVYEEKKKAEEIKVGDILHEIDTNNNHVIVGIYDEHYETIVFNGTDFDSAQINRDYTLKTDYEKLDKNVFNEVSQLLDKLKGE